MRNQIQGIHNITNESTGTGGHNTKEHVDSHPPSDDEECLFEMFLDVFTVGH